MSQVERPESGFTYAAGDPGTGPLWIPENLMGTRSYHVSSIMAPLQISGHIDGVPFFYRARHGRFTLETMGYGGTMVAHGADSADQDSFRAMKFLTGEMLDWIRREAIQYAC